MRKVDGLSPVFIDFYVPALTLLLNITETSLQSSSRAVPYIEVSLAKRPRQTPGVLGVSFMYTCMYCTMWTRG
jgi:hypothetical protein